MTYCAPLPKDLGKYKPRKIGTLQPCPNEPTLWPPPTKQALCFEPIQQQGPRSGPFIYFFFHIHTFGFFASRESLIPPSSKTKRNWPFPFGQRVTVVKVNTLKRNHFCGGRVPRHKFPGGESPPAGAARKPWFWSIAKILVFRRVFPGIFPPNPRATPPVNQCFGQTLGSQTRVVNRLSSRRPDSWSWGRGIGYGGCLFWVRPSNTSGAGGGCARNYDADQS